MFQIEQSWPFASLLVQRHEPNDWQVHFSSIHLFALFTTEHLVLNE